MYNIYWLLKKDILLELRQKHIFFGILLYVLSTIFVIFLAMGSPDSQVYNGLFWIIQLFVCVNAVAKSFLQESKGRMLYYYTVASPLHFIISKLLYSTIIMSLMILVSLALFSLLFETRAIFFYRFAGISLLGGISISLVFTLMAAIAAKAQQNAAVMAVLGFPLIIPQLLLLIRLSKSSFGEVFKDGAVLQMSLLLTGLDVLVIALATILFPFLWKD